MQESLDLIGSMVCVWAGHRAHEFGSAHGYEESGNDKHAEHSVEMFRERFWLTLILSVPTLAWSPSLQAWLNFVAPTFPLSRYVPAVFGTAVYLYGGVVVVLVRSDPRDLPRIIALSRANYRKMNQNLWWAAGYAERPAPSPSEARSGSRCLKGCGVPEGSASALHVGRFPICGTSNTR